MLCLNEFYWLLTNKTLIAVFAVEVYDLELEEDQDADGVEGKENTAGTLA